MPDEEKSARRGQRPEGKAFAAAVGCLLAEGGCAFLMNGLPLGLLLPLTVALFAAVFLLLDRVCFKEKDGTPDSMAYSLGFLLVRLLWGGRQRLIVEDYALRGRKAPYVLLCNHASFRDFYYISRLRHPRSPAYLANEYYLTRPFLRFLTTKSGFLSKKLFTPDMGAALGIRRTVRKGVPVVVFPEGRLSPDGRSNPIVEPAGAFYKKLNVDVALARIEGAYYAVPKWRKAVFRTTVRVSVARVLEAEEIRGMTDEALDRLIADALYTDESAGTEKPVFRNGRAKGLENLLYRCADCGALYTTQSRGNTLGCTACGAAHTLDRHYRFSSGPASIAAYYDVIRRMEKEELCALNLCCPVETRVFSKDCTASRKERGECRLTPEAFSYRSGEKAFSIPTAALPALAFSCGEEFELYHEGELHYFNPVSHPEQAARWALAVDLLAERRREQKTP